MYVPDFAGVVERREVVGQDLKFELKDGRVFSFRANGDYLGGTQPAVGDLLLSGAIPERWVYRATFIEPDVNLTPPDCYRIFGHARATATQVFQTVSDPRGDVVMVFSKGAAWTDVGFVADTDTLMGVVTCINPRGEAIARTY